jgi:hypothetical protein
MTTETATTPTDDEPVTTPIPEEVAKTVTEPPIAEPVKEKTTAEPAKQPEPVEEKKPTGIAEMFGVKEFKVKPIQDNVKETYAKHHGNMVAVVEEVMTFYPEERKELCYAMLLLGKVHGTFTAQEDVNKTMHKTIADALKAGALAGHAITLNELHKVEPETIERLSKEVMRRYDKNGNKELDF